MSTIYSFIDVVYWTFFDVLDSWSLDHDRLRYLVLVSGSKKLSLKFCGKAENTFIDYFALPEEVFKIGIFPQICLK